MFEVDVRLALWNKCSKILIWLVCERVAVEIRKDVENQKNQFIAENVDVCCATVCVLDIDELARVSALTIFFFVIVYVGCLPSRRCF